MDAAQHGGCGEGELVKVLAVSWLVALAAVGLLSGCQRGMNVSFVNGCSVDLEFRNSDGPLDESVLWSELAAGARSDTWGYPVSADYAYVETRVDGDGLKAEFVIDLMALPVQEDGADRDVVLEGDRCPP